MKFSEAELKKFLAEQYEPRTIDCYTQIIKQFISKNGNIDKYNLHEVVEALNNEKITCNATRGLFLGAIKKYYDFLIVKGVRKVHPCRNLFISYTQQPVQFQKLFTINELNTLLDIKDVFKKNEERYRAILSFLINQALHSAEICNIKIKHVNFDTKTIYIKGSKTRESRVLDLNENQINILNNYLENDRLHFPADGNCFFFVCAKNQKMTKSNISVALNNYKMIYPDRILNAITIRQSIISYLLAIEKNSLESVQLFAGHRWPSSTKKYDNPDKEDKIVAINNYFPNDLY